MDVFIGHPISVRFCPRPGCAGDYAIWARIWCNRMQSENWPYLTRSAEPCAAERIERHLDKLDTATLREYAAALKARADQFRAHADPRVQAMVAKLDARGKEVDKMLAAAATNTITNRVQ